MPHNVLIATLRCRGPKYKDDQQFVEFFRQLKERLEAVPGVQAAGGSVNLPLDASGYAIGRGFIPEGRPLTVDEARDAMFSTITAIIFARCQFPLLSGRAFEPRDNADGPKVVIINETTAKRHFGSPTAAIGKRLSLWSAFRGHRRDEEIHARNCRAWSATRRPVLSPERGRCKSTFRTPRTPSGISWGC
jgi:hypothetical protein